MNCMILKHLKEKTRDRDLIQLICSLTDRSIIEVQYVTDLFFEISHLIFKNCFGAEHV